MPANSMEKRMRLPVLHVSAGDVVASAAQRRAPYVSTLSVPSDGLPTARDTVVLARILAPARFRLTFGGYAGAVELLVLRATCERQGDSQLRNGERLPLFSLRAPVHERLRELRRGQTVECVVRLCTKETIVCPNTGELTVVPLAADCHSLRTIGR